MKLFLTVTENCKEGIFVHYIGITPYINIFKPEYLEVNKIYLLIENNIRYIFYIN